MQRPTLRAFSSRVGLRHGQKVRPTSAAAPSCLPFSLPEKITRMLRSVIHLAEKGFKMAAGNELAPSAISKCCGNELKWREKFLGETSLAAAAPGDNTASAAETHPLVQQRPQCVVTWIQGDMLKKLAEPAYTGSYDIVFDCQVFHVMRVVDEQGFAQLVHSLLVPGGVYITIAGNAHEAARNPGPPVLSAAQVVSPLEAAGLQLLRLQRTHFAPTPAYGDVPPMAWLAVFSKPGVHGGSPLEQALTV